MAKKKRRLGRRPRPDMREAGKSNTSTKSTGGTLEDAQDSAAISPPELDSVEEDSIESPLVSNDHGTARPLTDPGRAEGGGASLSESSTEDDAIAAMDPAVEDENNDVPSARRASDEAEEQDQAQDALPSEDRVASGDVGETFADVDDADESSSPERKLVGDTFDGNGFAEPDEDADPNEFTEEPPLSFDGPRLVGEGVEIDESQVEDTEGYLKGLVEAVIFSSDRPQTEKEVARAAKIDTRRAQELIESLIEDTRDRGVRLVAVAEGYAFRTNPAYSSYVREFLAQRPVRLSRAQLETLAIIAYRQPITRPEVDDIRGVDSGAVVKTLLERDLVRILGKKDEPGRPMIYGTTPQFLDLFSLNSLRDLPTLREFTELSDDSRAKFELEVGEPAPEGPLAFPDETSTEGEGVYPEDASDQGGSELNSAEEEERSAEDDLPVAEAAPEAAELDADARDASSLLLRADEEVFPELETSSDDGSSDPSDGDEDRRDAEPDEDEPDEDELAEDELDDDEGVDADDYVPPPVSPEDEEEFPDDEDDDESDDEDEDEDDDELDDEDKD